MPTEAFDELDEERKQNFIQAAIAEFSSLPYDKVSMFKIAENAGVSRSGLYYYFKDKSDIYLYITDLLFQPFQEAVRSGERTDPFVLSRDFFLFFAEYKHTEEEAWLRQTLHNARSMDIETMVETQIDEMKWRREMQQITSMLDLSALRVNSADDIKTLFFLLHTLSVRLLLAYIDDRMSFEEALAQLDRTFDGLRYGFVKG